MASLPMEQFAPVAAAPASSRARTHSPGLWPIMVKKPRFVLS